MKSFLATLLSAVIAFEAHAQTPPITASPPTDAMSVSYALGVSLGLNLKSTEQFYQATNLDADIMTKAIKEVLSGQTPHMTERAASTIISNWTVVRQKEVAEANLSAGKAYVAKFAGQSGAVSLTNGICYHVITEGVGPKPALDDIVVVEYRGKLIDGREFDSSFSRNQPWEAPLRRSPPGWMQVLPIMKTGSKLDFVVPAALAFGEPGSETGAIPPNSLLVYEVELLGIKTAGAPAPSGSTTNSVPKGK